MIKISLVKEDYSPSSRHYQSSRLLEYTLKDLKQYSTLHTAEFDRDSFEYQANKNGFVLIKSVYVYNNRSRNKIGHLTVEEDPSLQLTAELIKRVGVVSRDYQSFYENLLREVQHVDRKINVFHFINPKVV